MAADALAVDRLAIAALRTRAGNASTTFPLSKSLMAAGRCLPDGIIFSRAASSVPARYFPLAPLSFESTIWGRGGAEMARTLDSNRFMESGIDAADFLDLNFLDGIEFPDRSVVIFAAFGQ